MSRSGLTRTVKMGNQIPILVMVTRLRASPGHGGARPVYFNCKKHPDILNPPRGQGWRKGCDIHS
jgi:hypothetical protein